MSKVILSVYSGVVTEEAREKLKKLHTGTLKKVFEAIRASDSHNYHMGCSVYSPKDRTYLFINGISTYVASYRELKEILNTREHIPNKQERKLARQKKAHDNRN